ncbi:effector-associated domain EAD1-containing protein [Pseudofrankia inefficax]|uniref:effector-associated domain EAD1-containing protein n=1 Tax=Pseudofrankia inefficax (strain DSM 45817 / CECT 9037 / DDB 130130 / EuI1c) TaxID=298654 RepID=UPI0018DFC601|nr:effector-associated domain EAD1-containing protein [Pseudofrankia inefficax]
MTEFPNGPAFGVGAGDIEFSKSELARLRTMLAHLYQGRGEIAQVLQDSIGLAPARLPQGNMDPDALWGDILEKLEHGIACTHEQPFRGLLEWLLARWPRNRVFRELARHLTGPDREPKPEPEPDPEPEPEPDPEPDPEPEPDDRPRWNPFVRRSALLPSAGILAVLAVLSVLVVVYVVPGDHGCTAPKHSVSSLAWVHGECVGYSDGSFQFGRGVTGADQSGTELVGVQKDILAQNRCADVLRARHPSRTFLTLVYFAGLGAPRTGATASRLPWAGAQVAELLGLLTWQRQENVVADSPDGSPCRPSSSDPATVPASSPLHLGQDQEQDGPILRVIIASGGMYMDQADRVAEDQLIPFAQDPDQAVAAIVGLDRSLTTTVQAITDFGDHGILTLGTTLSGDGLPDSSWTYFQMEPQNLREALLVTDYALLNHRRQIDILYPKGGCGGGEQAMPDEADRYVFTLVRDMVNQAAHSGLQTTRHGWQPEGCPGAPSVDDWMRAECPPGGSATGTGVGTDDLVFYAGRAEDFGSLTRAGCLGTRRGGPLLLADDAITEYVTEYTGQESSVFPVVSKGPGPALSGTSCADGDLGAMTTLLAPELPQFCARLRAMYEYTEPPVPSGPHWTDERTAIAYDAAKLVLEAVDHTAQDSPFNINVLVNWIRQAPTPTKPGNLDLRPDDGGLVDPRAGTTGSVDFHASQVADSRQLAILTANLNDTDPYADAASTCLVLAGDPPATTDCWARPVPLPVATQTQ